MCVLALLRWPPVRTTVAVSALCLMLTPSHCSHPDNRLLAVIGHSIEDRFLQPGEVGTWHPAPCAVPAGKTSGGPSQHSGGTRRQAQNLRNIIAAMLTGHALTFASWTHRPRRTMRLRACGGGMRWAMPFLMASSRTASG